MVRTERSVREFALRHVGREVLSEDDGTILGRIVAWCQGYVSPQWYVLVERTDGGGGEHAPPPGANMLLLPRAFASFRTRNPAYVEFADGTPNDFEAIAAEPELDLARFPGKCPRCKSPAYVGMLRVECSRAGCS
jgi:hypothetical protein